MLRRTLTNNYKILLVESPNKVQSVRSYVSSITDMSFGRKELAPFCKGGERIDVFATIGHFQEMTKVFVKDTNTNDAEAYEFRPEWIVTESKRNRISEITGAVRANSDSLTEVILATDPDREGELITAHAFEAVVRSVAMNAVKDKTKFAYSRAYIHSITHDGVAEAMKERRVNFFDQHLANAANARHLLDRVFGFYGSRLASSLDHNIKSVGRVQSPALILVHDRCKAHEDVINNRVSTYSFSGKAQIQGVPSSTYCSIKILKQAYNSSASGESSEADKNSISPPHLIYAKNMESAQEISKLLNDQDEFFASKSTKWNVTARKKASSAQAPSPLSLQALILALSKKYKMSSAEVTDSCQRLFVAGLITYPRTDSTRISDEAIESLRQVAIKEFGADSVETKEALDKKKSGAAKRKKKEDENVEDAHEAVRPTKPSVANPPGISGRDLDAYHEIRNISLASVMIPRKVEGVTLVAVPTDKKKTLALVKKIAEIVNKKSSSSGETVKVVADEASIEVTLAATKTIDEGWRKAILGKSEAKNKNNNNKVGQDEDDETNQEGENTNTGDDSVLFDAIAKFTSSKNASNKSATEATISIAPDSVLPIERKPSPPPLFLEGTLIEELKKNGIGRPSTYSTIMETLHRRGYISKDKSARLLVTPTGEHAVKLSRRLFPEFVALDFTAAMEADLDKIISGASVHSPVSKCLATLFDDTRKACVESFADATQLTEEERASAGNSIPACKIAKYHLDSTGECDFEIVLRELRNYLSKNYHGYKPYFAQNKDYDNSKKSNYSSNNTTTKSFGNDASTKSFAKKSTTSSSSSSSTTLGNDTAATKKTTPTKKTATSSPQQTGLTMPTFRKKK